jgi:hypothetical protein
MSFMGFTMQWFDDGSPAWIIHTALAPARAVTDGTWILACGT